MTNWTTDEHGNRNFEHGEWHVRIWAASGGSGISVTARGTNNDVEIRNEGIWVYGYEARFGRYNGNEPASFTIPWEVITAIIEARNFNNNEV
jgi:hypothetical protein